MGRETVKGLAHDRRQLRLFPFGNGEPLEFCEVFLCLFFNERATFFSGFLCLFVFLKEGILVHYIKLRLEWRENNDYRRPVGKQVCKK